MGGSVLTVAIYGSMIASTIAAGIDPGADGFFGTTDDTVLGTSTVGRVTVMGLISGSVCLGESHGVFAASNLPIVTHLSGDWIPRGDFVCTFVAS